jgi:hypothetical protein
MAIYKATKLVTHALIIGLLIVIIVMLARPSRSGFTPSPLLTQATGVAAQDGPKSLFDIKPSIDCTPGPAENASYYTMGLTPGGLCDDSQFVRGQLRDYSIVDGVGGSLLEKS